MFSFHAVMLDETGCEFGVSIYSASHADAAEQLAEDYPESRIVQLETTGQSRQREADLYHRLQREMDGEQPPYDWD